MSLTAFLRSKDVKERFRQEFRIPRPSLKKEVLVPPHTNRYSTVGTAFDYLFRFYINRLNPNAVENKHWVAETALIQLQLTDNVMISALAESVISQAKERLATFLQSGEMTDELIESALLLAYIDPIYRVGIGHELVGTPVDKGDIEDLRELISMVNPEEFRASKLCLLNPTFGAGSRMVGAADADIVIDDMLIDLKTTKNFGLKREYIDQLLGYYTLHRFGSVGDLEPKAEITKVALYFSRQAYLHVFDLEEIINQATFDDFMQWFKERAKEDYD